MEIPRIRIPRSYHRFRKAIRAALKEMVVHEPSGRPAGSYKRLPAPWDVATEQDLRRLLTQHTDDELSTMLGLSSRTVKRYRERIGSRRRPVKGPLKRTRVQAEIAERLLTFLAEPHSPQEIAEHFGRTRQWAHEQLSKGRRAKTLERVGWGLYQAKGPKGQRKKPRKAPAPPPAPPEGTPETP